MAELFLERNFDPPINQDGVFDMALAAGPCFSMHRVEWRFSLLSKGGRKMVCWFHAPDMESVRIAMRQFDIDMSRAWRGSVHDKPGLTQQALNAANVLVERRFDEPASLQDIQAIEDAGIRCLETRQVSFVRTFFSADQKRMICLYQAPDAESVRLAQRQAKVPFDDAWAFQSIFPGGMAP